MSNKNGMNAHSSQNVKTTMKMLAHPTMIIKKKCINSSIIVIHVLFLLFSPDAVWQATGLIWELSPSPSRRLRLREIRVFRRAGHRLFLLPDFAVAVLAVVPAQDL